MSEYQSIKELVVDEYLSEGGMPSYEKLTDKVLKHFPASKWQKTHYSWYKSKIKTGKIAIDDPSKEPEISESDIEESINSSIELQVSLEKDLQKYYSQKICEIEDSLVLLDGGIEYTVQAGRIDLLAKDGDGHLVVIELKAGLAKDAALGQLLGYIGCLSESHSNVRGILLASEFDQRVVYASRALPQIKLVKYQLSFKLNAIT